MKIQKLFYVILIFCFGCKTNIDTSEEIINKFIFNKKDFEILLQDLKNNPVVDSLYRSIESIERKLSDFPPDIYLQLNNLGVSHVYLHSGGCGKPLKKVFIFKTNWNSKVPIIVDNNPCDTLRTKDKYYSKDQNNNEFWGFGDFWQAYKEVKIINVDQ